MPSWEKNNSLTDQQIIDLLLCNDSEFVESFFKNGCRPLLNKINWDVFDNKLDYFNMFQNFMFYIQQDDWRRLRSFKGESSLWGWLKVIAIHYFYNNRQEFLPELSKPRRSVPERRRYDFDHASESAVESILEKLEPTYEVFIRERHLLKYSDEEVVKAHGLSSQKFKEIERKSYQNLKTVLQTFGSAYEKVFIIPDDKIIEVDETEIIEEPSTDEESHTVTRIDVQKALNSLDDRDRYVLRSLIIEDKKRIDIAEELGVTPGYLDIIRNRALKKMRNLLEKK